MKKLSAFILSVLLLVLPGCVYDEQSYPDSGAVGSGDITDASSAESENTSSLPAAPAQTPFSGRVMYPGDIKRFTPEALAEFEYTRTGEPDIGGLNTLADLEESALIVIGTFVDDPYRKDGYSYLDRGGKVRTLDPLLLSFNTIEITEVIKGSAAVGDTVEIAQQCGMSDDGKLTAFSMLTPMLKGERWLFFLEEGSDAQLWYWYAGDYFGRYPLPGETYHALPYTEETAQYGVYDKDHFPAAIYKEILEKYMPGQTGLPEL